MEVVIITLLVGLRENQKVDKYLDSVAGAFEDWREVKGVKVDSKHATKADEASFSDEEVEETPAPKAEKPVKKEKSEKPAPKKQKKEKTVESGVGEVEVLEPDNKPEPVAEVKVKSEKN